MTVDFFYYSVPKRPADMTPDELVQEIRAGKEAHYHAEGTGQGISTKEHVRQQNCELELVSRPHGIDRWNEEFGRKPIGGFNMQTKVDVQGEIHTIGEVLGKAAEADGLGVAEAVSLVIQDCLGHPWVDEELKAHMAESLCGLFTKHVQAVNLPTEEEDDEAETQRRDEKRGLYGGLVDDSN